MSLEQCETCLSYFDINVEGDIVDMVPYCEGCIPEEEESIWDEADMDLYGDIGSFDK
jgi:hypothetical protein